MVVKLDDKRTYVLLIKPHGRNRWQLPKGAIDPGETPRSAAVREVREEGGVIADAVEALRPIKFFYQMNGKKYVKTVDFFLMKYRSGSALDHDEEVDEARWFPLEQAVKTLTFESEKDVVSQAILALQHQSPQPEGSVAS